MKQLPCLYSQMPDKTYYTGVTSNLEQRVFIELDFIQIAILLKEDLLNWYFIVSLLI
jgi:hypothetical protein